MNRLVPNRMTSNDLRTIASFLPLVGAFTAFLPVSKQVSK